jgi:hypothetical protein
MRLAAEVGGGKGTVGLEVMVYWGYSGVARTAGCAGVRV